MKKSGTCPKCGSKEIATNLVVPDHTDYGVKTTTKIDVVTAPNNILFKGRKAFELRAWICCDCGFLEQYIQSPRSFAQAYREGESGKR